jgi:anti-sigma regulatory factor (Ser/Thr protein kinase)
MLSPHATFEHEAMFYEGPAGFLTGALPFIREGLEAEEPMLVAVPADRIAALRDELGSDADAVRFADMAVMGRNPGRIIPAWREFVAEQPGGRPMRGIGEPIWAGRSPAELVECQLHESLLNLAFADAEGFRLMCPYDVGGLDESVIHAACCSHPVLVSNGESQSSADYPEPYQLLAGFEAPLPPPATSAKVLGFQRDALDQVRDAVTDFAVLNGLGAARLADLVLAVNEAAANSVRHGGGNGILRVWRDDDMLVCEIRDRGLVSDPLVGRRRPDPDQSGGWGVWIAHQVCDLVQLRSGADGTVLRLFMQTG